MAAAANLFKISVLLHFMLILSLNIPKLIRNKILSKKRSAIIVFVKKSVKFIFLGCVISSEKFREIQCFRFELKSKSWNEISQILENVEKRSR